MFRADATPSIITPVAPSELGPNSEFASTTMSFGPRP